MQILIEIDDTIKFFNLDEKSEGQMIKAVKRVYK